MVISLSLSIVSLSFADCLAISLSISSEILLSVTCAYICILDMEACPIILAMLSIGIPAFRLIVPKVCLAIWYDYLCLIPQALPTMLRFLPITLRVL